MVVEMNEMCNKGCIANNKDAKDTRTSKIEIGKDKAKHMATSTRYDSESRKEKKNTKISRKIEN